LGTAPPKKNGVEVSGLDQKSFKFSATNELTRKGSIVTQKSTLIGIIGVAIAIVALIASVYLWTMVDNLGKKTDDLENRLSTIENKSWHTIGDYTLTPSKTSETFQVQGEQSRITFTFNEVDSGMRIGYNLRVYDPNGNIVAGLSGIELSDLTNNGKGTLNILEGAGTYTVEILDIMYDFTFSFTVEEFY
jgi:nitrogen fixation-related uncharacterized protein